MALENEYKSKNEFIPKESYNQDEPKEKSTPKKEKEKKTTQIKNPLKDFSGRFDKEKLRSTIGAFLILLSFYFFLACLSYIFTWTDDQDRVLDKSLFEFLFEDNPEPVSNWLGKFGAWTSHLFIYKWFGLSSFGFCFLFFISGVKILFKVSLVPIKRAYAITSIMMVWSSLFLGFFANQVNYLGGSFGYHINDWLKLSLGSFGAFILIAVLFYFALVILFNPNFKQIFDKLFNKS